MPAEGMRRGNRSQVHAGRRTSRGESAPQIAVGSIAVDRVSQSDVVDEMASDAETESSSHADSLRLAVVAEPRTSARRRSEKRPAIIHLPIHPVVPRRPPSWMLEQCQVAPARAGDQSEIIQLLSGLPVAPTRAEFHAAVDHPEHDPGNRLVARLAGRIVGHVEVMPRTMMLGGAAGMPRSRSRSTPRAGRRRSDADDGRCRRVLTNADRAVVPRDGLVGSRSRLRHSRPPHRHPCQAPRASHPAGPFVSRCRSCGRTVDRRSDDAAMAPRRAPRHPQDLQPKRSPLRRPTRSR